MLVFGMFSSSFIHVTLVLDSFNFKSVVHRISAKFRDENCGLSSDSGDFHRLDPSTVANVARWGRDWAMPITPGSWWRLPWMKRSHESPFCIRWSWPNHPPERMWNVTTYQFSTQLSSWVFRGPRSHSVSFWFTTMHFSKQNSFSNSTFKRHTLCTRHSNESS